MNKPKKKGIKRLVNAFFYSMKGFKTTYQNETAFRQELIILPCAILAAFWLAENGVELALMLGSFGIILLAELINSALESVVDRIGSEYHLLSGQAKDIGSAIVLLAIILCTVVWTSIIFYR